MGWGEVRGQGGKSFSVKGTGNKTGTFYYNKMCLFANRSDPVLNEKLIMGEQKEGVLVEGKTWKGSGGWGQGQVKHCALEKERGCIFHGTRGRQSGRRYRRVGGVGGGKRSFSGYIGFLSKVCE